MDKRDLPLDVSAVSISIETKRIVEDIHLQVEPGEIVGLIGPNGSGKSTLLRSVYRMLKPEAGYVRLGESDVWKIDRKSVV